VEATFLVLLVAAFLAIGALAAYAVAKLLADSR
jgi:hypothetical protein